MPSLAPEPAREPGAPESDAPQIDARAPRPSTVWWGLAAAFVVLVVLLFIPWTSHDAGPTVDIRPELVVSSILTVVLGAFALAVSNRWTAYVAAIPTFVALSDLSEVLWPATGSYPVLVEIVTCLVSVIGVVWLIRALQAHSQSHSVRLAVAPVASALTIASLWLPWIVVSGIGVNSGPMTAFTLLFGNPNSSTGPITIARIAVLVIVVIGAIGSLLPLIGRNESTTRIATVCALGSVLLLAAFTFWLGLPGDAVQPADNQPGPRVALACLMLLALIWQARLGGAGRLEIEADENDPEFVAPSSLDDDLAGEHLEHSPDR